MKTREEFGVSVPEFTDPNADFFTGDCEKPEEKEPSGEFLVLIPKSAGDLGDSAGERTEFGRGGI